MVTCSETEDMNDVWAMSDVGVGWLVGWLFDGMVEEPPIIQNYTVIGAVGQ